MKNMHGDFIWYELMTTEPDAAVRFYGALTGWTSKASSQAAMDYREWWIGDAPVGGMMALSPEMREAGARPLWAGYVHVDDVDAQVPRLQAAGATILMGPQDVPGVGRFVYLLDPQGAPLYVMTDSSGQASTAFAATEPMVGHCAWNELATSDPDAAKAFYGQQFGWVKDGDMDMGPLGKYEFLKTSAGRPYLLGAVLKKPDVLPVSMWTFYFRVPDIDRAAAYIPARGGDIVQSPSEIPGGQFSLVATDPQGAAFGLVGPRLS